MSLKRVFASLSETSGKQIVSVKTKGLGVFIFKNDFWRSGGGE